MYIIGDSNGEVVLTNISGQKVYIGAKSGASHRIDLSHLAAGIYFVSFVQNNEVQTKKLLIR